MKKLPYFIKYTNAVKGGDANMCFVRIEPKYKDDAGLQAHEYEHVKQWYRSLFVIFPLMAALFLMNPYLLTMAPALLSGHNILYRWVRKYRLYCEVRAFKAQLVEYEHDSLDWASKRLATDYNLDITVATAKTLLQ